MKKDRTEYFKQWRKEHPSYHKEYNKKYLKDYAVRKWLHINSRCNNPKSYHFRKGIKNLLKINDIRKLWRRDKGYMLKEPSIDRINPLDNYTFENCRFIEFRRNCSEGGKKRWQNKTNTPHRA